MSEAERGFDLRGLLENSLLEWEDRIVAVAIAGGCNWRCPYCHSWRYVTGVADLEPIDPERLFALLERQHGWIDGVVVSGGEPTLQPGLMDLIRRIRDKGVKVKLHSNGSRPEVLRELLSSNVLDCLALDYKAPLDERLFAVAGIDPEAGVIEAVRESFALARQTDIAREYHTTLAPGIINLDVLAEMASSLEGDGVWFLQQFEPGDCLDPKKAGQKRFNGHELDEMELLARERHGRINMKRGKQT